MKIIFLITFLISSIFANVAIVSALNGKATIQRDGNTINLTIGFKIDKTDNIQTLNNTKLQLLFTDRTVITVGQNSQLLIKEYVFDEEKPKKVEARFHFVKGLFRTVTGKIGKLNPDKFKIKVRNASIGIRGTRFDVYVSPLELKIGLFQGKVYLLQNNQTTNITSGQTIVYKINGTAQVKDGILKESKELNKQIKQQKTTNTTTNTAIQKNVQNSAITNNTLQDTVTTVDNIVNTSNTLNTLFNIEGLSQTELDAYLDKSGTIADNLSSYITPTATLDGYVGKTNTATFTGTIKGTYTGESFATGGEAGTGNISLTANFGAQTITGSITNLKTNFNTTLNQTTITNTGFIFNYTAGNTTTINVTGKFYGANAAVTAGTMTLDQGQINGKFVGEFIGKK